MPMWKSRKVILRITCAQIANWSVTMAVSILRGGTRRFIIRALLGLIFLVYLLLWHLCSFNTYVTFDSQQSRAERW